MSRLVVIVIISSEAKKCSLAKDMRNLTDMNSIMKGRTWGLSLTVSGLSKENNHK